MLKGLPPFSSRDGSKELFRKIMSERVKMPDGASAAACKLLKGLLNRNVLSRLGTTKSTMFEVGGVAALKKQPFFQKIDWDKLERKELDPPERLDVNNDEDLQHFHKDFTNMALPRSVVAMNKDDYRSHRVASEAFRGFSFIQDDFKLPDRRESDVKHYWESVEGDAESESDKASSKVDFSEDALKEEIPVKPKKKRGGRKKKKKKAGAAASVGSTTPVPSAVNTPVPSAVNTPAASVASTPVQSRANSPVPLVKDIEEPTKVAIVSQSDDSPLQPQPPTPEPKAASPPPPPNPEKEKEAWQMAPSKKKGVNRARAPAPVSSQQPQRPVQQSAARNRPVKSGQAATLASQRQNGQQKPGQRGYTPVGASPRVAGGWNTVAGSRQPAKVPVSSSQNGTASGARPTSPRRSPVAPSTDWRQHMLSPSDSSRSLRKVDSLSSSDFPSLTSGPPLMATSQSNAVGQSSTVAPKAATASPAPKGAWASRSKR